jgi:hypothetical protein
LSLLLYELLSFSWLLSSNVMLVDTCRSLTDTTCNHSNTLAKHCVTSVQEFCGVLDTRVFNALVSIYSILLFYFCLLKIYMYIR